MEQDFYAEIAPIYDRMIRWRQRLATEGPLFEKLWRRTGVQSVLDASCGSGRHLPLFVAQGRHVAGADASSAMLALAAEQVAALPEAQRPPLTLATWDELPEKVAGEFDCVLCLGNSLPYVTEPEVLRASLAGLWRKVAPGGMLLIQFKNFAKMRARGERYLPVSSISEGGVEYVAVRQYEWHERTVDFNVIMLARAAGEEWSLRTWTTPLATYAAAEVAAPLRELGARVELCGSLKLEPYDKASSEDVVIWAKR